LVGSLVVGLTSGAAAPVSAQLADPLSLAASGVLLPFFSDPAAGFVSVLEIASPVVPSLFTNPIHAVFFREDCARSASASDLFTSKQAKAFVSNASPLLLNFNGLAAIASTVQGNDLVPLSFPIHARTHWIDIRTGRVRALEPIILDSFLQLNPFVQPLVENPGAGGSVGLCDRGIGVFSPFRPSHGACWSPLRSAATFVTPQESASLKASIYLICPTADIQNRGGEGVFAVAAGFPRMINRDGSGGFPRAFNFFTAISSTAVRARIYDDDEKLVRDTGLACACLTSASVLNVDSVYALPPANLGGHTVPVWYTELEADHDSTIIPNQSLNPFFSFIGYWGLEITGHAAALFHRMSSASLDNLSIGTLGDFGNR
jgi:hypothetical protein